MLLISINSCDGGIFWPNFGNWLFGRRRRRKIRNGNHQNTGVDGRFNSPGPGSWVNNHSSPEGRSIPRHTFRQSFQPTRPSIVNPFSMLRVMANDIPEDPQVRNLLIQ